MRETRPQPTRRAGISAPRSKRGAAARLRRQSSPRTSRRPEPDAISTRGRFPVRRARARRARREPSDVRQPAPPAVDPDHARRRCGPARRAPRLRSTQARRARVRDPRRSVSDCELTETYSPAAIDIEPATRPATPAMSTARGSLSAAATPSTRLAVDTMPSLAPSTAARSQPMRVVRCRSAGCGFTDALVTSESIVTGVSAVAPSDHSGQASGPRTASSSSMGDGSSASCSRSHSRQRVANGSARRRSAGIARVALGADAIPAVIEAFESFGDPVERRALHLEPGEFQFALCVSFRHFGDVLHFGAFDGALFAAFLNREPDLAQNLLALGFENLPELTVVTRSDWVLSHRTLSASGRVQERCRAAVGGSVAVRGTGGPKAAKYHPLAACASGLFLTGRPAAEGRVDRVRHGERNCLS